MKANRKAARCSRTPARGQVLIIFVFAIIGLIGITGLAIDGGNIFSDRRHAQNAADTAAMTAALTRVNTEGDIEQDPGSYVGWGDCGDVSTPSICGSLVLNAALDRAAQNGYTGNLTDSTVEVHIPPIEGPYSDCADSSFDCTKYIQVIIDTNVNTWFARVLGVPQMHNHVSAVAMSSAAHHGSPFPGSAIIGLDPNGTSFAACPSASLRWILHGGGIFANHNACAKTASSVTFDPGFCATAVNTATGFGCTVSQNNPSLLIHYPTDIPAMLPPIPPCDGVAYTGSDGKIHEQVGKEGRGSKVNGFDHQYAPGLYCIYNAGGNIHNEITGDGVTFYVMDSAFTMKYNGGGAFATKAPTSGTYAGVLMFSNLTSSPCTQNVQFRGNGHDPIVGTVFMPSACIDWRGNSNGIAADTQLIGYDVTSNGTADPVFDYNADNQYQQHFPAQVGLSR